MDPLTEQLIKLVERVPFAVIVALWFMFRLEAMLQRMQEHHTTETVILTEIRDSLRRSEDHAGSSNRNN